MDIGTVDREDRAAWLDGVSRTPIPVGYAGPGGAVATWRDCITPEHRWEVELASRLIAGHGNDSASAVGLTLHHTWGVPIIPGTALKGLAAHYLDVVYGPRDRTRGAWDPEHPELERAPFQGAGWRDARIAHGPGAVHRTLFGAPSADDDPDPLPEGRGPTQGSVVFHDALWLPAQGDTTLPLVSDVLTVHQKPYYDARGRNGGPNDYESPSPVAFLSVRTGARFLIALSGSPAWVGLARRLLTEALVEWGVGGKTSAGYGRIVAPVDYQSPFADLPGGGEPEPPLPPLGLAAAVHLPHSPDAQQGPAAAGIPEEVLKAIEALRLGNADVRVPPLLANIAGPEMRRTVAQRVVDKLEYRAVRRKAAQPWAKALLAAAEVEEEKD